MFRATVLALALCLLCPAAAPAAGPADAAAKAPSPQAQELRRSGDLVPYAPPGAVLDAYFTADETAPRNVWGPVAAYAKSRACRTAWLIEKGELARVERLAAVKDAPPFEFSLTLEEDCPGAVTHAVFVSAPGSTAEVWFKWRRQFHGSKAAPYYAEAEAGLKRAEAAGKLPTAELRFLSVNGELVVGGLEQALEREGRLAPVFPLQPGK
jgi:hypothetical protein